MNEDDLTPQASRARGLLNAQRLLDDAELLVKHGRVSSAFALSVLGLEEVGKAVLFCWEKFGDVPRTSGVTFHVQKQTAVAHLLMAPIVIDYAIEEIAIPNIDALRSGALKKGGTFDKGPYVEALSKKLFESEDGEWLRHVKIGVIDLLKQIALYDDGSRVKADVRSSEIHSEDVDGIVEKARRASKLMEHELSMKIARASYCLWDRG